MKARLTGRAGIAMQQLLNLPAGSVREMRLVSKSSCKTRIKFLPYMLKPKSTDMKKLLIGALVGGLLVFAWQTLSWTVFKMHDKEYRQAKNQDSIISYLNSQFTEDGQYMIPRESETASAKEMEDFQKGMQGKPWAVVSYHKAYNTDMVMNIIRGLIVAIITVFFVCWVLMKQSPSSFSTTFISCLLIGLAGYLFIPYSGYIWFQTPGAMTHMIDALASWGLCGIWLGWWLNKK